MFHLILNATVDVDVYVLLVDEVLLAVWKRGIELLLDNLLYAIEFGFDSFRDPLLKRDQLSLP